MDHLLPILLVLFKDTADLTSYTLVDLPRKKFKYFLNVEINVKDSKIILRLLSPIPHTPRKKQPIKQAQIHIVYTNHHLVMVRISETSGNAFYSCTI